MAKADPNSTTNTPISDATSRRNFLTSAAGIAAGATALAAIPALAPPTRYSQRSAHVTAVAEVYRQLALDEAGLIGDNCSAMLAISGEKPR